MGSGGNIASVSNKIETDKMNSATQTEQPAKAELDEVSPDTLFSRFWPTVLLPFWKILICNTLFGILFLFGSTMVRTVLVVYLLYVALDTSPTTGGFSWMTHAMIEKCRHAFFYKAFTKFYPVKMVKTADLPPDGRPYILCYHPHGVVGVGACSALLTNGGDFDTVFPGIPRRIATLNVVLLTPFLREWLLMLGFISVNKSTLVRALKKKESVVLLPGGAVEALYATPNTFQLCVQRRKGFVKLAMEHDAQLVPILGFGENSVISTFTPKEGSFLGKLQQKLCKMLSFSMPIITSPFPRQQPVHVVVGKPVKLAPNASVEENHALYLKELEKLYNDNKAAYGHEKVELKLY